MNAMQITKKAVNQLPAISGNAAHWLSAHRAPVLTTAGIVSVSGLAGYLLYKNSGKIRKYLAKRKKPAFLNRQEQNA